MCGTKLEQVRLVPIDDNDPLDLETPVYRFEDRSKEAKREPAELRELDRQRELVRDSARRDAVIVAPANRSSVDARNFPPDTVAEEVAREIRKEPASTHASEGIGGPSFLGLGYTDSNSGFVYDTPRNADTEGELPEYLLEEPARSISWRAWALLALLVAGVGLGYIQWRASHNQGPDLASILSGNGATVNPSGPVMTDKSAKPANPKPSTPASDSSTAESAKNNDSGASSAESASSANPAPKSEAGSDAETASAKPLTKTDEAANSDSNENSDEAAAAPAKGSDEDGKPESDGPGSTDRSGGLRKPAPVVDEKPAPPKSLGDKDPLIVQAEKYIQGRGAPQNCSAGVNLLRQSVSAGNPAANVKMGALYWSGTCVTQSKPTAYQWFSRAHSLEPQNRWIERSRNSLWASMSSEEQRRVGY